MNAGLVAFVFCVFITVTSYPGVKGYGDENNRSLESSDVDVKNQTDSSEEGPPDSHEAMNNRELKPKLTIGGDRKKRSYQFLMGLVKRNNSNYEVTNDEDNMTTKLPDNEAKAGELLLELMVKIAENPEQWSKVHELLQKIDKDLLKSKQILENIRKLEANRMDSNSSSEIQKLDLNHDRDKKNVTAKALASNQWPVNVKETTKYPWQVPTKPEVKTYQKNFAYHRVTGNPLVHTNYNKNPKAYIAVSVIAPKPIQTRSQEDDLTLENELKELKPWTHQQNLKNMAQIRSRWVIQSNEKKALYSP